MMITVFTKCFIFVIDKRRSFVASRLNFLQITNSIKPFHTTYSLRKRCPYSELFYSVFLPHLLTFGLNTERYKVFLRIQSECGKMLKNADQNNSEYGHFLRSVISLYRLYKYIKKLNFLTFSSGIEINP